MVPAEWQCVCGLSMLLLEAHSSVDERQRAPDAGSFSTAEAPTSYIVAPSASKPRALHVYGKSPFL